MQKRAALVLLSLTSAAVPAFLACGGSDPRANAPNPDSSAPNAAAASISASATMASMPPASNSARQQALAGAASFGMTAYVGDGGAPPPNDATANGFGAGGLSQGGGAPAGAKPGPPPSMRDGQLTVAGKLAPEVVKRILRQSFGPFRTCYEAGLAKDPKLEGRVSVKFVVDASGSVSTIGDDGSDLKDKDVVSCIMRRVSALGFPQPESGIVTVKYPLILAPPPAKP